MRPMMSEMNLPDPLARTLEPLFEALPPDQAMQRLVVETPSEAAPVELVAKLLNEPALADRSDLAAGLWLYVDELDRSHRLSQQMSDPTGAFWHAIMHRREGDFSNSKYWFSRAGQHPAMEQVGEEYDPVDFVDDVARAHRKGEDDLTLIDRQRREWSALFEWCAAQ